MAFKLYQNVQKNTPLDSQENGKLKTKFKQPVSPAHAHRISKHSNLPSHTQSSTGPEGV